MTRFVIGPDAAWHLAQLNAVIPPQHQLLAPTLIRSQWLAHCYACVQRGELDHATAQRRLDYLRGLPLRLLGDRVLQEHAWKIADRLGWPDTFVAEYLALTQLQAQAFICIDPEMVRAVATVVKVASIQDLLGTPADRTSPARKGAPPASASQSPTNRR